MINIKKAILIMSFSVFLFSCATTENKELSGSEILDIGGELVKSDFLKYSDNSKILINIDTFGIYGGVMDYKYVPNEEYLDIWILFIREAEFSNTYKYTEETVVLLLTAYENKEVTLIEKSLYYYPTFNDRTLENENYKLVDKFDGYGSSFQAHTTVLTMQYNNNEYEIPFVVGSNLRLPASDLTHYQVISIPYSVLLSAKDNDIYDSIITFPDGQKRNFDLRTVFTLITDNLDSLDGPIYNSGYSDEYYEAKLKRYKKISYLVENSKVYNDVCKQLDEINTFDSMVSQYDHFYKSSAENFNLLKNPYSFKEDSLYYFSNVFIFSWKNEDTVKVVIRNLGMFGMSDQISPGFIIKLNGHEPSEIPPIMWTESGDRFGFDCLLEYIGIENTVPMFKLVSVD